MGTRHCCEQGSRGLNPVGRKEAEKKRKRTLFSEKMVTCSNRNSKSKIKHIFTGNNGTERIPKGFDNPNQVPLNSENIIIVHIFLKKLFSGQNFKQNMPESNLSLIADWFMMLASMVDVSIPTERHAVVQQIKNNYSHPYYQIVCALPKLAQPTASSHSTVVTSGAMPQQSGWSTE